MTDPTAQGKRSLIVPPGRSLRRPGPHGVQVDPLPDTGVVVLGRGGEADLCVEDSSVSRRHARLVTGASVSLEDLGSTNGTWLRGERLIPGVAVVLSPGDVFDLGDIPCTLQGGAKTSAPPADSSAKRSIRDEGVILVDPAMVTLDAQLARFAASKITILLLGETGVGKEVFARRVHAYSPRAREVFVPFNCAALPEALIDSELFGYERGAFTGAVASRKGLLESANGGTVFLDEVGELSLEAQAKLLRVLQERRVRPVGAKDERPIDVRFVAATNRDLQAEYARGRFREDLYYRLRAATLRIPSLRERPMELAPLAKRFVLDVCVQNALSPVPTLGPETLALLAKHRWPGNIRELFNEIEHAVLLSDGTAIRPEHFSSELRTEIERAVPPFDRSTLRPERPSGVSAVATPRDLTPDEQTERARIITALDTCVQNQSRAAELLGFSRKQRVA